MNSRGMLIFGTGLAGVGKTTHLVELVKSIPGSVYLNKDSINIELGSEFDPNSDYYKNIISPKTYEVMMERANLALAKGKTVICDGYFGDKLTTSTPVLKQLQKGEFLIKIIYFHCSGEIQQQRLIERGSKRDQDKKDSLFAPYRKKHLESHLKELSQVPYLVINTENESDLSLNIQTILDYLKLDLREDYCFTSTQRLLSEEEAMMGTAQFTEILDDHKKYLHLRKKYPSLFLFNNKIVRYQPLDQRYVGVDVSSEGHQRKRCLLL